MPWNGRMLGYRMRDGQYYIIPEEAEIVRRIIRHLLHSTTKEHSVAHKINAAIEIHAHR